MTFKDFTTKLEQAAEDSYNNLCNMTEFLNEELSKGNFSAMPLIARQVVQLTQVHRAKVHSVNLAKGLQDDTDALSSWISGMTDHLLKSHTASKPPHPEEDRIYGVEVAWLIQEAREALNKARTTASGPAL